MIKADNATKRFDDITAVDHICAEVQNGSVYGLIGSNGLRYKLKKLSSTSLR